VAVRHLSCASLGASHGLTSALEFEDFVEPSARNLAVVVLAALVLAGDLPKLISSLRQSQSHKRCT